jgi:hypothetical protein
MDLARYWVWWSRRNILLTRYLTRAWMGIFLACWARICSRSIWSYHRTRYLLHSMSCFSDTNLISHLYYLSTKTMNHSISESLISNEDEQNINSIDPNILSKLPQLKREDFNLQPWCAKAIIEDIIFTIHYTDSIFNDPLKRPTSFLFSISILKPQWERYSDIERTFMLNPYGKYKVSARKLLEQYVDICTNQKVKKQWKTNNLERYLKRIIGKYNSVIANKDYEAFGEYFFPSELNP